MDDEANREGPGGQGRQGWADELAAARGALEEARRQVARSSAGAEGPAEAFDPARVAYEMELAEHRSTTERAHRAELAARDLTIGYQQERIDRTNAVLVGLFRKSLAEGGKATKSASPEGPASAYSIRGEASIARSRTVIGLTNSGLLRLRSEGPVSSCPPTCLALLELLA